VKDILSIREARLSSEFQIDTIPTRENIAKIVIEACSVDRDAKIEMQMCHQSDSSSSRIDVYAFRNVRHIRDLLN